MSTQKFLECVACDEAINVSEVANENCRNGNFHDGAEIDITCHHCGCENQVEVNIHVSCTPTPFDHGDVD